MSLHYRTACKSGQGITFFLQTHICNLLQRAEWFLTETKIFAAQCRALVVYLNSKNYRRFSVTLHLYRSRSSLSWPSTLIHPVKWIREVFKKLDQALLVMSDPLHWKGWWFLKYLTMVLDSQILQISNSAFLKFSNSAILGFHRRLDYSLVGQCPLWQGVVLFHY